MRFHQIVSVTLAPSLLDNESPATPNGAIHVSIARQFEDSGEVFTKDVGDAQVTNAALVARARELFADIAAHYATENATPVRARADVAAPLVQPTRR
jgi:hypothetical protein